MKVFNDLFDIANDNLIFRFQDKFYRQLKGLAMGVASSPDIANLYGAYFKEQFIPTEKRILFYRRYIDDVLAIVEADDHEEALKICSGIKFNGCEIVWSANSDFSVFLDMFIFVKDDRVHYRVYKKGQNNQERIPWASHHPVDVKRGTFIGEITRMATLSSTKEYYEAALKDLRDLYVARGYPPHLVKTWLVKHATARWKARLAPRELEDQSSGLHVLKTVFNGVWDYVNIHAVHEAIMSEWKKELLPGHHMIRQLTLFDVGVQRPPRRTRRRKVARVGADFSYSATVVSESDSDQDEEDHLPKSSRLGIQDTNAQHNLRSNVSALAKLVDQRMILSRRRPLSIGDLSSTWRKNVLRYNDEEHLGLPRYLVSTVWGSDDI
ncbi:hypothetical protein RhiJN_23282 [Ceratobasidium sp. AG-Ba]|nr:hypothetical protein RhiJN_23282 [Ceratobasidium sp. AG-Ba]